MMEVRTRVDQTALKAWVARDGVRVVQPTLNRVANLAKVYAPVDTGRLRGSIGTRIQARGLMVTGIVEATARHSLWVHEGTGLYGPRHAYITPRRGTYLVFRPRGSSRYVFARRVSGMRPRRFLVKALQIGAPGWSIHVYTAPACDNHQSEHRQRHEDLTTRPRHRTMPGPPTR